MVGVRITMEGVDVVSRRFKGIAERAADLTPAWPQVLDAILTMTSRAFVSEGASTDAGAWPPLARTTQLERARKGFGAEHPILRRTNRLMISLIVPGGEMIWLTTPTSAAFGSNVEYFKYHQSRRPRYVGTTPQARKLPRRAPVLPTQDDKHSIVRVIRLWVTGVTEAGIPIPAGYRGEERIDVSAIPPSFWLPPS